MDTPEQPSQDDELLATNQNGPSNRRVRKKRVRLEKDEMYAIELHRRKLRIRLMIALGVLVFAAILATVAAWYPGTEGFRNRLNQMMLNSTGAKIEIENVELKPFEANADRLEASWPEGNFLKSFSAEGISATVLPQRYFSRTYGGDEVRAANGKLSVRYPDPEAPAIASDEAVGRSRVNFKRIGIPKFEVQFGDAGMASSATIVDTEAAFYTNGPSGMPRALIYSGNLNIPFWPSLLIERAIVEFPPNRARITSMRIRDSLPDINSDVLAGGCDISGEISLDPAEVSTLQFELDGFQIQGLLGEEAGRFFLGRVDTRPGDDSGVIRISQDEGLQMRADLVANSLSQITLNHFPFLAFLARSLDDRWFLNPMFEDAPSMVLIRDGGETVFDEINFTSRHRMAIRGSFSIDIDDVITGEIEVGLSPTVIDAAIARRLDGMFSMARDDFRWVKLELGGTTQVPTDNFNAQFIEAPMPEIERPQTLPPAPPEPEPQKDIEPKPRSESPPSVLPLLEFGDE